MFAALFVSTLLVSFLSLVLVWQDGKFACAATASISALHPASRVAAFPSDIGAMQAVRFTMNLPKTRIQLCAYWRSLACNLPIQKAIQGTGWHVQGSDLGGGAFPPFE